MNEKETLRLKQESLFKVWKEELQFELTQISSYFQNDYFRMYEDRYITKKELQGSILTLDERVSDLIRKIDHFKQEGILFIADVINEIEREEKN